MARLLFVHAHPDDETLVNGVAMAHHARAGHEVHLLTSTLGEEGEVIPADLSHLELLAGQPRPVDIEDPLAEVRRDELVCAISALEVASSQVLPGNWRDSGMVGSPASRHPRAFASASVDVLAVSVAAVVREVRPDVVVTYDRQGGYGHPDHIQTHLATVAALRALPEKDRPRLFATLTPQSWASGDREWLRGVVPVEGPVRVLSENEPYPPSVVADATVTHEVVDTDMIAVQSEALVCHRTQVSVHHGYYALSNDIAARLSGREGFAEIDPETGELIPGYGPRQGLLS